MISRRDWLGKSLGAGAALALGPGMLRALERGGWQQASGPLLQRPIPSTGELLPAISYGPRDTDGAATTEVLKTLAANGGKVVDALHGGPVAEQGARAAAREAGIEGRFFWTTPVAVNIPLLPGYAGPPLSPSPAAIRAALEQKLTAFKVPRVDLVMVPSGPVAAAHIAALAEMKKEGRVRYVGVHHLALPPNAPQGPWGNLESLMRNEPVDFIGTDYSAGDRRIEKRILPLAMERKIAVMAYFPFDRRRIFERASSTPLPEWAAEFDAKSWAQFFLKYVLSHPGVTVVRTGTTKAAHMLENIGAGMGRLPNEEQRKRMAALVDTFPRTPVPAPPPQAQAPQGPPVVLPAAILDRYVGEYHYAAAAQDVAIRRDGERLFWKVQGNAPEAPLAARSETRFQAPAGIIIEFQLEGQGKVTGAIVEMGPNRLPLQRK